MKTYVGTDGKLHFVNSAGADTALNFSSGDSLFAYYAWNQSSEYMGNNTPFKTSPIYANDNLFNHDSTTITAKQSVTINGYITGYERAGGAIIYIYINNVLKHTYNIGNGEVAKPIDTISLNQGNSLYFMYKNTTSNVTNFSIVLYG